MSNETKTNNAIAIIPRNLEEVRTLSATIAKSSLLPDALRGKEADVLVSIMAGQELGLSPMAALRGVHVVKGKPVLAADTMVGVVLGSGLADYFTCIAETATSVTYETKRRGAPQPQQCTWTMEDAKRAGLDGDNWRKYPRAMLKARCKAMLARDCYPDVLAGCYEEGEGADLARERGPRAAVHADVPDAELVSETPTQTAHEDGDALLDSIAAADTLADLESLVPRLQALTNGHKAEARKLYGERKAALSKPAEAIP